MSWRVRLRKMDSRLNPMLWKNCVVVTWKPMSEMPMMAMRRAGVQSEIMASLMVKRLTMARGASSATAKPAKLKSRLVAQL